MVSRSKTMVLILMEMYQRSYLRFIQRVLERPLCQIQLPLLSTDRRAAYSTKWRYTHHRQ